jgi:DNA-binding XRE family transcriptional regulator
VKESKQHIGQLIRKARAIKGLTQKMLAEEAGVNQSAISMMEQGKPQSLSDAKLVRLGEVLGLDLLPLLEEPEDVRKVLKYCTCPTCISNLPMEQDGRLFLMPMMVEAAENEVSLCRFCGMPLEQNCAECASLVYDSAVCLQPGCGHAYVVPDSDEVAPDKIDRRYRQIREFFDLRALMASDQERVAQRTAEQRTVHMPSINMRVREHEADSGTTESAVGGAGPTA